MAVLVVMWICYAVVLGVWCVAFIYAIVQFPRIFYRQTWRQRWEERHGR